METYSFEFLPINEIFIFTENCNYRWKATCLKSRMQKTEQSSKTLIELYGEGGKSNLPDRGP